MTISFRIGGKKAAPARKDDDLGPKDGSYIAKHDLPSNAPIRDGITNKVLVIGCGFLAAIAILEGIAITMMIPGYKVVPVFVTFSDKADQVVRIEPPSGRLQTIDILAEQFVRDYVVMRHTITTDKAETIDRWGSRVRLMSTETTYSKFLEETKPIYDEMEKGNFTRTIKVNSVLRTQPGFYQVELESFDRKQGQGLADTEDTRTQWIVQMRVGYIPKNVSYQQRNLNPFGFTVFEYSVARKR